MRFSDADQAAMIAAIGEDVTIGGTTYRVDFRLNGQLVEVFSGSVESVDPVCRITAATRAAASVQHGTSIVARGISYKVIQILPEQAGWFILRLQKV